MFATRDQENLANAHQTTAAAKPLNQGVRALQPKTPGNHKTPFRAPRNDENKPLAFQGQKTLIRDGTSKLDKNAFVTPAAPRNRAPLGAKTTNAKAQPFKTPGLVQQSARKDKTANRPSTARRSGRSKITVAPTDPIEIIKVEGDVSEDEPDFGYAPPPVSDLPDLPPDVDLNRAFPPLVTEDMFRGYGEIFHGSPKDESGFSIRAKREQEEYREYQEQRERDLAEQIERERTTTSLDPDKEIEAIIAAGPKLYKTTEARVDTLQARSAAIALSQPNPNVPSVALKQTASSRAKQVLLDTSSIHTTSRSLHNGVAAPHPVSKNTIGFPKAKKAPSIIPSGQQLKNERVKKSELSQKDIKPRDFVELYGEPPVDSEMWYRLKQEEKLEQELQNYTIEEDDLADEFFKTDFLLLNAKGDEEDEIFQLPMPEE